MTGMTTREPVRLVELNHEIVAGMTTYPGLPGPEITPHVTRVASRKLYAAGTEFAIDRISMVGNTGTYLDSPFHRYPDGTDLAGVPLTAVADLRTGRCGVHPRYNLRVYPVVEEEGELFADVGEPAPKRSWSDILRSHARQR